MNSKKCKKIKVSTSKKTQTRKRTKTYKKRKNKIKKGGEAVVAGSYGCVFRPSLKCIDPMKYPYKDTHISKLMYNDKSVVKEVEEMDNVKEIIKTIPNNDKYFLVMDTNVCDPAKLSDTDLNLFDEKCDLFTDNGINSKNVNSKLSQLKLINIPDGGMEIDDYILKILLNKNEKEKYKSFIKVNSSLIELLNNGIVPINQNGLIHMDIKGNNMLVDDNGNVRLIDWGLASKNNGSTIPDEVTNHTFHYNAPFSNLFYNDHLKTWLPNEYKKIKASSKLYNPNSGQSELLKIIAVNMLNNIVEYNKTSGHYSSIVSILHSIYKIYSLDNGYNTIDYNTLIETTIIEYIQTVLLSYVDSNGTFKDLEYYYDVFSKNADIWGFLMGYIYIIEKGIVYDKDNNNNAKYLIHQDILNGLCRIIIKYCYSKEFAVKPINVSELSKELESLNKIAYHLIEKKPHNTKNNYIVEDKSI